MQTSSFMPLVRFDRIDLKDANNLLVEWSHKMGKLERGNQGAICYALFHNDQPVALTTTSHLISPNVAKRQDLTRVNTCELSRLCAAKPGLCRVALRLWREFVFTGLPFDNAISYQDADLHNGNTYRFDGWERIAYSRSGTDTRSGRPGRNKYVWKWPPTAKALMTPQEQLQLAEETLGAMGWENYHNNAWRLNGGAQVIVVSTEDPLQTSGGILSNDLAALCKKWLIDKKYRILINLVGYEPTVPIKQECFVRIVWPYESHGALFSASAPTENEALCRAVLQVAEKVKSDG